MRITPGGTGKCPQPLEGLFAWTLVPQGLILLGGNAVSPKEICDRLRFFGLFNQQKLLRDQTRNSGKPLLGLVLAAARGSKHEEQVPLFAFRGGQAGSLNGARVRVDGWVGQEP